MFKKCLLILTIALFASCTYFKKENDPQAVARVGDSYLYASELDSLVPKNTSKEDSTLLIKSYIDRWVTRKLLVTAAERNLDDAKKEEFSVLVRQYKNDLYTKAYIEKMVQTTVDTVINDSELRRYYDANKENFKTNGTLVQLRYLHLSKDHPKYATIKSNFLNFKKSDAKFWRTYQMQFKNSALNDSVWVSMNEVYRRVPFITPENRDKYISEGMAFEKSDSLNDVYLVKIKKVINRNQISPFEYLKPTLQQVILNRRKLELIKKFEKEITEDAIKNKDYEVFK
ncbi:hypothetical protein [Flavobacterium antarcticum]|uniref:hypothetical protein n=1 Tax=Flavobacterium antarcticum TaxID=271155 RepID=UPI0003B6EAD0|nr:hypothetical protein [Flavobacterium antarcticum]